MSSKNYSVLLLIPFKTHLVVGLLQQMFRIQDLILDTTYTFSAGTDYYIRISILDSNGSIKEFKWRFDPLGWVRISPL